MSSDGERRFWTFREDDLLKNTIAEERTYVD